MSENPNILLEKKLADEREKLRLNAMKTLKFLGYKEPTDKMTQEQLDARIELLMENNAKKEGTITAPTIFVGGIDEAKDNAKAAQKAQPTEAELKEYMEGYDALTAHISQLRPNSQVAHATQFGAMEDIRIIRLPASIRVNKKTTIQGRLVL